MQFLDFEKPIQELYDELEKVKESGKKTDVNVESTIKQIEKK